MATRGKRLETLEHKTRGKWHLTTLADIMRVYCDYQAGRIAEAEFARYTVSDKLRAVLAELISEQDSDTIGGVAERP
jgi:hypothetical protein